MAGPEATAAAVRSEGRAMAFSERAPGFPAKAAQVGMEAREETAVQAAMEATSFSSWARPRQSLSLRRNPPLSPQGAMVAPQAMAANQEKAETLALSRRSASAPLNAQKQQGTQ